MYRQRNIGLHLRVQETLLPLAYKALHLEIPFFQSFLLVQATGRFVAMSTEDRKAFLLIKESYFKQLYAHGSYWINLAGKTSNGYYFLRREIVLAKTYGFTHLIVHPGSAKGCINRVVGIETVVRTLNKIMKHEKDVQIVLENTAHGNMAIGSDLLDLKEILIRLDKPELLRFCIDTSHAHVFGYHMQNIDAVYAFIELVDDVIGWDRVALIHLNDTVEACGTKLDRHEIIGCGVIGVEMLKAFICHSKTKNTPVILEPPLIEPWREYALMRQVCNWRMP